MPCVSYGNKTPFVVLFRTRLYLCELQLIPWYTYIWRESQKLPFMTYVFYICHYYHKYFWRFNKLSHKLVEIMYSMSFLIRFLKEYEQIIYETWYFRKDSFLGLRHLNIDTGRRNLVNWQLIGIQKKRQNTLDTS